MSVAFTVLNITNVTDFVNDLEKYLNYLEKATVSNLGDFTDAGKIANAGYNNYTVYWDWYKVLGYGNLQGEPYCAGFVSTALCAAFGLEKAKKILYGNLYTYCPTGYNQFNAKGMIKTTPQVGDVVFFWSTSLGRWGHTGIVVGVDSNGKGYTTIEANTSSGNNTVVRNGGATCKKHYTLGLTKEAFGRPAYEANGISLSKPSNTMVTYEIGTGAGGLKIMADSLNVRSTPATGDVISSKPRGSKIYPTLKTFVNGAPWVFDPDTKGWLSAEYMEGWMLEKTYDNKWWYVENGYTYQTNIIKQIDGVSYFFDASGYMFNGTISFTTDESGALKVSDKTD